MSNLFKPEMTLQKMNEILESYCLNNKGGGPVLAIKAIPLTHDDYMLLRERIDGYINFTGDVSAYFDVQLCIIVTWIFGENFQHKNLSKEFIESMMTLPQHHLKSYFGMFASTMIEYNLETFGEDYEDMIGICNIIHKHADI